MKTNLSRPFILTTLIILTLTSFSPRAAAQPPPPPPINPAYNKPIGITPVMIILFISIILTFFLMGCLSVYARRCVDYDDAASGAAAILRRPSVSGLDPAIVASFPAFVYSEVKGLKIGKGALECAVCLCEFDDVDTLRLLPKCCHVFHQVCIDTWLRENLTCPVCRDMLVPCPGEITTSFVLPVREPVHDTGSYQTADDDIIIDIQHAGLAYSLQEQTAEQSAQQPVPAAQRSTSRRNRLFGKFKRSFTTGHVVVKPDDDYTRFTLRLPEEVRSRLVSRSLGQAKTGAVFPRARSQRTGFRSASVGDTNERSLMNYERFEPEGRHDRWRFRRTLSMFSRTGLVQSPNRIVGDIGVIHVGNASLSLSKSAKSSFQFGTDDVIKENVNVGERSFDRLRFDGDQV